MRFIHPPSPSASHPPVEASIIHPRRRSARPGCVFVTRPSHLSRSPRPTADKLPWGLKLRLSLSKVALLGSCFSGCAGSSVVVGFFG